MYECATFACLAVQDTNTTMGGTGAANDLRVSTHQTVEYADVTFQAVKYTQEVSAHEYGEHEKRVQVCKCSAWWKFVGKVHCKEEDERLMELWCLGCECMDTCRVSCWRQRCSPRAAHLNQMTQKLA